MGIRLENVSYQDKIKNISYEFEDGKITTVIGSSSSGKTLLSYLLSGIIDDYTGNIISTYKNREIGYIFQRPEEAFIFETVKEELAFGIRKYNYRVDEANIIKLPDNNEFSVYAKQGNKYYSLKTTLSK